LDFAANVAAGLRILQSKWNETRAAGLVVNNGDPSKIENWFFAVWAYNSGFHPQSEAAANDGAWGVGWANNPANPRYPANRGAFLEDDSFRDDYADAAHPQDWPYPEKVMGWAGHPVEVLEAPDTLVAGYRPAWWCCEVDGPLNRHRVSPPHNQFCDASNDCEWGAQYLPDDPEVIGEPAGPCAHRNAAGRYDLKCWYHEPTTWKSDCELTCGNELLRFDPGYPYQEDGTAYPPACDLSGLPAGSRVIDNLPDGTPSVRPDCGRPWVNAGTFNLSYGEFGGEYPGKIDTHQLGMGLGGHFWMANARTATTSEGVQLKVTGRWRFTQAYTGVATVWAHLPPLVNGTTQARYTIKTKYGDRVSVVNLRGDTNRWVRLGVFRFDGPPEVTLTTITPDGDGTQRIAFDAVAYTPATSSRTLKVLHWNIAGATINDGDYYVVDRLVQEILARQPDIVSVNEICVNQFDTLRRRLADAGYEMGWGFNVVQTGNFTCFNLDDPRFTVGNAVLVRGTVVDKQNYDFSEDQELVEVDDEDTTPGRGVACVTARFSGTDRDVKACSTHLETGYPENPDAGIQVRELARVLGPQARQMPFILAGDTNLATPRTDSAMDPIYGPPIGTGDFGEIEQERACVTSPTCELAQGGAPTFDDRKIDYIFADRWHFHIPVGRAAVNQDVGTCGEDPHPCSDHFLVYGEAVLPAS
jgi:hypothetical protein